MEHPPRGGALERALERSRRRRRGDHQSKSNQSLQSNPMGRSVGRFSVGRSLFGARPRRTGRAETKRRKELLSGRRGTERLGRRTTGGRRVTGGRRTTTDGA